MGGVFCLYGERFCNVVVGEVSMKIVKSRLKEPSTWAGFAALAMLFGVEAEQANLWMQAAVGIAASLAVVLGGGNGSSPS